MPPSNSWRRTNDTIRFLAADPTLRNGTRERPQVVQPDRRQPGLADQMTEAAGQDVGVQRRAVLGDEDVPSVLPDLVRRFLLDVLPAAVLAEQPDRVPVQSDQPAAGRGLRLADGDQVAVSDALLLDHRHPGVQVDVCPPQPRGFTTAQAAQRDQPPHHHQAVLRNEGQEGRGLLDRPYGY